MARMYKKSPIVEVVCDFQFEPDTNWDLTAPGLIYEKVHTSFPVRQQQPEITTTQEGLIPKSSDSLLIQFAQKDKKALIQVGPNRLVVNRLAPYRTWKQFRTLVSKGLSAYQEIVAPTAIHRIGLHYINLIQLPESPGVPLEKYFQFYPVVSSQLAEDFASFIIGIQIAYEKSRDTLVVQLTDSKRNTGKSGLILGVDYILAQPGAIDISDLSDWLEAAHQRIENSFEACLTGSLRELFEEVTE